MRLISQNGNKDVEYENMDLEIRKDICIYAYSSSQEAHLMGRYSSKEKALKAMEMLREEYVKHPANSNQTGGNTTIIALFMLPKVFQFPKDEDVEV